MAKELLQKATSEQTGGTAAMRAAFLSLITGFPGLYIKEACDLLGINPRTVKRWNKTASFRKAFNDAKKQRFTELYRILESGWLAGSDLRPIKRYLFNFDPDYQSRTGYLNWRRRAIAFLRLHGKL